MLDLFLPYGKRKKVFTGITSLNIEILQNVYIEIKYKKFARTIQVVNLSELMKNADEYIIINDNGNIINGTNFIFNDFNNGVIINNDLNINLTLQIRQEDTQLFDKNFCIPIYAINNEFYIIQDGYNATFYNPLTKILHFDINGSNDYPNISKLNGNSLIISKSNIIDSSILLNTMSQAISDSISLSNAFNISKIPKFKIFFNEINPIYVISKDNIPLVFTNFNEYQTINTINDSSLLNFQLPKQYGRDPTNTIITKNFVSP